MFLPSDARHPTDFDFFIGDWNVRHRRLKRRLVQCADWEQFAGRTNVRQILGGFGNVDDNLLHLPDGTYRAATLRSFDPRSQTWSIWWLDARNPASLDVPVVGRFEGTAGTFFAHDHHEGQPIIVRFLWTASPEAPRWEQAFSPDRGASWETNWVMEFTRRPAEGT